MIRWVVERRRRRRHAWHRYQANRCPVCLHPWGEHADAGNDQDGVCGECLDDIAHAREPLDHPTRCTLRGPADLVADYPDSSRPHAWQSSWCPCHPLDCGQTVMSNGQPISCDLPPDADIHRC